MSILIDKTKLLNCFCLITALFIGCDPYEKPKIKIEAPDQGQFLPANTPIQVEISGPSDQLDRVRINGGDAFPLIRLGSNRVAFTHPAVDGVGFVTADLPDDPYLVNRSWLQGEFIPSAAWYPDTFTLRIAGAELNEGNSSIAGLLQKTLENAEVSEFVNPIEIEFGTLQAQVIIDSAVIEQLTVTLMIEDDQLRVNLVISPLILTYRIESDLITTTGSGRYDIIRVNSDTLTEPRGVTLLNPDVELSDLEVQDDQLPDWILNLLIEGLLDQFKSAVTEAISEVTMEVTGQLFSQLRPTLGLELPFPINQETTLAGVFPLSGGLELQYQTKVGAVSPQMIAAAGALSASPPRELIGWAGSSIHIGKPLLNQYAFAAWDAGNFSNLAYSRARLEALGLGELEFPYSNIERAVVHLLLPPIAGWDAGGAYLELGGIKVDMKIDLSKDTQAWTSARIPIKLVQMNGALRILRDENREIIAQPIMLNRLNVLAERNEVLKLIRVALPGVVADVFGELPVIRLPQLTVQGLPDAPQLTIDPRVIGVSNLVDQWRVELDLEVR